MQAKTGRGRGGARNASGWQAQKSASTRNQILDAAIHCFVEQGYARTTTTSIAERAGLSRGAMLHHFPSKIDIVKAAVDHLHAKRLRAFRNSIATMPPPGPQRVRLAAQAYWRHVTHPLFTAFFELQVAARTDKELAAILKPAHEAFDQAWHQTALEVFPEWQADSEAFDLALDLTRFLLEGMAINQMGGKQQARAERMLEYFEARLHELAKEAGAER